MKTSREFYLGKKYGQVCILERQTFFGADVRDALEGRGEIVCV